MSSQPINELRCGVSHGDCRRVNSNERRQQRTMRRQIAEWTAEPGAYIGGVHLSGIDGDSCCRCGQDGCDIDHELKSRCRIFYSRKNDIQTEKTI